MQNHFAKFIFGRKLCKCQQHAGPYDCAERQTERNTPNETHRTKHTERHTLRTWQALHAVRFINSQSNSIVLCLISPISERRREVNFVNSSSAGAIRVRYSLFSRENSSSTRMRLSQICTDMLQWPRHARHSRRFSCVCVCDIVINTRTAICGIVRMRCYSPRGSKERLEEKHFTASSTLARTSCSPS